MKEPNTTAGAPSGRGRTKDRRVKMGFLAAVIVAGAVVYLHQRAGPALPDWGTDLPAALQQAQTENRPVLVFFLTSPPSTTARDMADKTLQRPQNRQAIEKGKFIRVKVTVGSMDSDVARKYALKALPTMMVLGPQGKELNRREGFIGELDFRNGFLDLSEVRAPS